MGCSARSSKFGFFGVAGVAAMVTSAAASVPALVPGTFMKFDGDAGERQRYTIEVDENQRALFVSTRGQRGEVDLIVQYAGDATTGNGGRHVSAEPGARERVVVRRPAAGTWYVTVVSQARTRNVKVAGWTTFRPGDEPMVVLPVGQTVYVSGAPGSELVLRVALPDDLTSVRFASWGGRGNSQLLPRRPSSVPVTRSPWTPDNTATLRFGQPGGGLWYLELDGASSFRNSRVRVDVDFAPPHAADATLHLHEVRGMWEPRVEFHNEGYLPLYQPRVTGVRVNGTAFPPPRYFRNDPVSPFSSWFSVGSSWMPLPVASGMRVDLEVDVEYSIRVSEASGGWRFEQRSLTVSDRLRVP